MAKTISEQVNGLSKRVIEQYVIDIINEAIEYIISSNKDSISDSFDLEQYTYEIENYVIESLDGSDYVIYTAFHCHFYNMYRNDTYVNDIFNEYNYNNTDIDDSLQVFTFSVLRAIYEKNVNDIISTYFD